MKKKNLLRVPLILLSLIISSTVSAKASESNNIDKKQGGESKGAITEEKDLAEEEQNKGEDSQIQNTNMNRVGYEEDKGVREQEQEQNKGAEIQIMNENKKGNEVGKNKNAEEEKNNNKKSESNKKKGQIIAAQHRSAVANFVSSLNRVAEKEKGIGEKVREIAKHQNENKEKVAKQVEVVEKRGPIATFLFGSDYETLGQLRKEMVQTENQIKELEKLAENAEGEENKAELEEQKKVLEQEMNRIQNFIEEKEGTFSLFGWMAKMFQ